MFPVAIIVTFAVGLISTAIVKVILEKKNKSAIDSISPEKTFCFIINDKRYNIDLPLLKPKKQPKFLNLFPIRNENENMNEYEDLYLKAVNFCSYNGAELGFDMNTFGKCVEPILYELQSIMSSNTNDDIITDRKINFNSKHSTTNESDYKDDDDGGTPYRIHAIVVEINSLVHVFDYDDRFTPDVAARQLAREFCSLPRGTSTVGMDGDTDTACAESMYEVLLVRIQQQL